MIGMGLNVKRNRGSPALDRWLILAQIIYGMFLCIPGVAYGMYCGHKTELFLDNLCDQESDNLRDHKQYILAY